MPFGKGRAAARVLRTVIAAAAWAGGRLPADVSARLAVVGGTLEWAARPRKRRILAENLARALGGSAAPADVRAVVREEFVNEARRSADFLWSVAFPERAARSTRVEGEARLRAALEGGRGAVLAGPHIGGWEVIVPFASDPRGLPVTALVEDDWLAWAVADIRRRGGVEALPVSHAPVGALSALRRGGVVLLLSDFADHATRTVEVTLLGRRVLLPAGPAALSRIAGAPLLPFAVLPIDVRAWCVSIGEAIPPPPRRSGRAGEAAAMQSLADAWSVVLRQYPAHWAAVQPVAWLT